MLTLQPDQIVTYADALEPYDVLLRCAVAIYGIRFAVEVAEVCIVFKTFRVEISLDADGWIARFLFHDFIVRILSAATLPQFVDQLPDALTQIDQFRDQLAQGDSTWLP